MTDNQFKFIESLDHENLAYAETEHSRLFKVISDKRDKISTRMAGEIIDYLKKEVAILREASRRLRGGFHAAHYYAANSDFDGIYEQNLITRIQCL